VVKPVGIATVANRQAKKRSTACGVWRFQAIDNIAPRLTLLMIKLENVSKYYPTRKGRHYVLKNVSLTIPGMAQMGVVGPNGAGKSTLMRLLARVDSPNEGRISATGTVSWPMGLASGLQSSLTGRENARFACHIQGVPLRDIQEKVDSICKFSEIGKFFEIPVGTYSSGMRARLNFAVAMAFDFDCYIIDELTAVGDKRFKEKSAAVFRNKRKASSFIKVSHNFHELLQECNCGLFIHDGNAQFFPTIKLAIDAYTDYLEQNEVETFVPTVV